MFNRFRVGDIHENRQIKNLAGYGLGDEHLALEGTALLRRVVKLRGVAILAR
ncbi:MULTISPECIES: hypothetical protein [unclassified Rhizobium]|uniref:hypothetical protein n=1 Tax=unclassified Rhizobium TaxID=2613769 RepID=UPI0016760781|nr:MULTISPECIES: hypothetical protein [unclassified Rhizobium]